MDESRDARWAWFLWSLTSLTLLSAALFLDWVVHGAKVLYNQLQILDLPFVTKFLLLWFDRVPAWLPVLAAAVSGIPFARKGDSTRVQRWCLVMILLLILLGAAIVRVLISSLIVVSSGLSGK
jgi:hypothetical protein